MIYIELYRDIIDRNSQTPSYQYHTFPLFEAPALLL